MSKKLEELILAASTTGKRQVWFTRTEVEHIASLVISECIDNLQVPKAELKDLSEYNKGWVSGRMLAIENIKKDFGITDA
jgi:hypothetical protein